MFEITGVVIEGKKRGRKLGYPTANIELTDVISQGIYISKTNLSNKEYNSVTFIGNAKTFDEEKVFAETYILDFDQDIYKQKIQIKLLKKIRDNEKFETVEKLIKQMEQDVLETQEYFNV